MLLPYYLYIFIVVVMFPVGRFVEYSLTEAVALSVLGNIAAAFTIDIDALSGITSTTLVVVMFASA